MAQPCYSPEYAQVRHGAVWQPPEPFSEKVQCATCFRHGTAFSVISRSRTESRTTSASSKVPRLSQAWPLSRLLGPQTKTETRKRMPALAATHPSCPSFWSNSPGSNADHLTLGQPWAAPSGHHPRELRKDAICAATSRHPHGETPQIDVVIL
ncbi:uncharacterized protein B0I36DRAFT_95219 [Microdochium trichocladiopsis]|uniref:Uncharacterized protein n=1 Tax=Microdochium trichocladiopsis TaxID=1682393 RepID=A0A9P8YER2_9PEZI|nr:uncharacterized protein B0I36DRAFT_95219 [Microdochium trichocladiopsis]KAH7035658.1 hypothetical protein B0I36DRAFT_95219 [Microdochium trichocladiopsis]